jgi:MAF protein
VIEFVVLKMADYVLASKSPRRKLLLRNLIDTFLVIDPAYDEYHGQEESPRDYVERIARAKALSAGERLDREPDREWVILAADTIVVDGDKILGKPAAAGDAVAMLASLRGRSHQVLSGIAVYQFPAGELASDVVCSEVAMREYTEKEINDYVASGDPLDKAGAYAIQNSGFNPAPEFQGCFANVMGLPLCSLSLLLDDVGEGGYKDVADRCQNSIRYQCPVYSGILSRSEGQ